MTMFQVLSKVIGTEELLGLVAFAKFVHLIQVLRASFPIRGIGEFLTAITAHVGSCGVRR
jgi:hypothetical protein